MDIPLTRRLIRLGFEIWSAYQYLHFRSFENIESYSPAFLESFCCDHISEFERIQDYADCYWRMKSDIRLASSYADIKPVMDTLRSLQSSLSEEFLDALYRCCSDMHDMPFSSFQEETRTLLRMYDSQDMSISDDTGISENVEDLEKAALDALFAMRHPL